MVDAIQKLKAEKAKILEDARRKAEALDADMRDLERLAEVAEKYGFLLVEKPAKLDHPIADRIVVHHPDEPPLVFDSKTPAYRAAINVSENALRAARRPLELSELFDACAEKGVPLAGKRPQSTLSAYLAHDASTVESIRRGLYWLKGVAVPSPFDDLVSSSKAS
jgi:hypothetical protein